MTRQQYTQPLFIKNPADADCAILLERLPLSAAGDGGGYDEAWLQALLFKNPTALPVAEIDASFLDLIPICTELATPAGPLDILFVNKRGMLTVVECKLWRNPEARRKVVGQILDYAKELSRWSYEDLRREISRALKQSGDQLVAAVKSIHPDLDEVQFIDNVSRNLKIGRFLLLISGDGIREGTEAIIEFLDRHAGLHFTFGLTELGLFDFGDGAILAQPRVLARTVIATRNVIEIRGGEGFIREEGEEAEEEDAELSERAQINISFWGQLIDGLKLDDAAQAMPKPSKQAVIWLPSVAKQLWITAFRSRKDNFVGVFLTNEQSNQMGLEFIRSLKEVLPEIERELDGEIFWREEDGKIKVGVKKYFKDIYAADSQEEQITWLRTQINTSVNLFRPRAVDFMESYET